MALTALVLAIAALAGLAWHQYRNAEEADRQLGISATRMVSETFRRKRDLRVGQLSGIVIARSEVDGVLFHTVQTTRAPATVNYLLNLQKISDSDYRWNNETKVMVIRIPDVTVETPSVDMAKAEVKQNGLWVSRGAGQELQRLAAKYIAARAGERARSQANIAIARRSALEGVRTLVEQPLRAAGLKDVRIEIVFPWDFRTSSEEIDRSRALGEVLGNRG